MIVAKWDEIAGSTLDVLDSGYSITFIVHCFNLNLTLTSIAPSQSSYSSNYSSVAYLVLWFSQTF